MPNINQKVQDNAKLDLNTQFARLKYLKDERPSSLPNWVTFFLELGASLADIRTEQSRYVAALAVPSRAFAASFLGAGFSYSYFLLHQDMNAEHVEQIRCLPNGTAVRYLDGKGRLKKAIKRNLVIYEGRELIGIQDEGDGNKTVYLPAEKISGVEISDEHYKRLPYHQKGYKIRPPSDLLAELLPERSYEYVFQTTIYGVVVGLLSTIKLEAEAELLIGSQTGQVCKGTLQELFRVEGTNTPSSGHRFSMHHVNNVGAANHTSLIADPIAIFDGSLSFTKWKELYRTYNWLIILDRTEPNFPNAVSQVNTEYANRGEKAPKILLPLVPHGVELMLFSRDI